MYTIPQSSTSTPMIFNMVSSDDHLTPKTGLTPTVVISHNGGTFSAPVGTVAEVGDGWYMITPHVIDFANEGIISLHATATGADPTDAVYQVVNYPNTIDSNNVMLGNVNTIVQSINNKATTINTKVQTLNNTDLSSVNSGITTIENTIGGIETDLTALASSVDYVKSKLDVIPDLPSTLNTAPDVKDITLVVGDDYSFDPITDSSANWHDLTGATASLIVDKCFVVDGVITTGATQSISFAPTHEQTKKCKPGIYTYSIRATWTTNNTTIIKTLTRGTAKIIDEPTILIYG